MMILSRRTLFEAGAATLAAASATRSMPSPIVLASKRFDELSAHLDGDGPVDGAFWSEFRATANQLVGIRATAPEDYFAKAKVAAWARLGDLDPPSSATLDIRIAISVLRDIVVQNDGRLYDGGALARMLGEFEGT